MGDSVIPSNFDSFGDSVDNIVTNGAIVEVTAILVPRTTTGKLDVAGRFVVDELVSLIGFLASGSAALPTPFSLPPAMITIVALTIGGFGVVSKARNDVSNTNGESFGLTAQTKNEIKIPKFPQSLRLIYSNLPRPDFL
jgi:hypothetical protein